MTERQEKMKKAWESRAQNLDVQRAVTSQQHDMKKFFMEGYKYAYNELSPYVPYRIELRILAREGSEISQPALIKMLQDIGCRNPEVINVWEE